MNFLKLLNIYLLYLFFYSYQLNYSLKYSISFSEKKKIYDRLSLYITKDSRFMEKSFIDYGSRINKALLEVIKGILLDLSVSNISTNHCFYITFDTKHKEVQISSNLKKQYPSEMTIILQNQFWDLNINDSFFQVTLSFNRKREILIIPFESIKRFNDPFVKFSLELEIKANTEKKKKYKTTNLKNKKEVKNKIISLANFRKKKD